jgi:hypothetical protein
MRALAFLIVLAIFIAAVIASEHQVPNDGLPLVRADYPVCVTVPMPPLRPPKRDVFHPQANGDIS